MSRRCPIDPHALRQAIDAALQGGLLTDRDIAQRYHVGAADVRRHRRACLGLVAVAIDPDPEPEASTDAE